MTRKTMILRTTCCCVSPLARLTQSGMLAEEIMPKGIEKSDWDEVHQLACDIANAAIKENDVLMESKTCAILELLSDLHKKYGDHPSIIATIGDYLSDVKERKAHYKKALAIAIAQKNQTEIDEIRDSLTHLDEGESQQPAGG